MIWTKIKSIIKELVHNMITEALEALLERVNKLEKYSENDYKVLSELTGEKDYGKVYNKEATNQKASEEVVYCDGVSCKTLD